MNKGIDAVMAVAKRPEMVFVQGKGSWLWDRRGRKYLDFVQGWACNSLGHSPSLLVDALSEQAAVLLNPGPGFYNEPMLQLAELLVEHSVLDKVFFANSGAEANEGAIKLARKWGQLHRRGAFEIITLQQGFHGRTLATMSASGKPGWDSLFEPKVQGFTKVPPHDLQALQQAINDNTVAVMLELVQGEAGVLPLDKGYVQALAKLAREQGLLLIIDEIQTGIGRTGSLFAYEQYGIEPDIMSLGKGLGGGLPLAALLCKEVVSCFDYGEQGGTFNGNPLVCRGGYAVLRAVLAEGFLSKVQGNSQALRQGLEGLSEKYGLGEVRGMGLLLALNVGVLSSAEIVQQAMAEGLLLNAPRDNVLRLMPALNVKGREIEQMLQILNKVIGEVKHGTD